MSPEFYLLNFTYFLSDERRKSKATKGYKQEWLCDLLWNVKSYMALRAIHCRKRKLDYGSRKFGLQPDDGP